MDACKGDGVGLKVDFCGLGWDLGVVNLAQGGKGAVPVNTQGCKPFTSQKGGELLE